MYETYDNWHKIAKSSYELNFDLADFKNIDNVVFAGMGGSGAVVDIFSSILSKTDIHTYVTKGYLLPKTVDQNTLVIVTSVSGNTDETLSILQKASKLKCNMIVFSSGGKMQQYCIKNSIEYRNVPKIHSPRASFPSFLYSMLKVLNYIIPVKKQDIVDSIKELEKLQKLVSSSNLTKNNPSLKLAEWVSGIPIIYYPYGLSSAAIRFKNSLQENAKLHCMAEDVLEASHNGIVAWEKKSIVHPIIIEGRDDYIKTKERWKIMKEYFNENKIDYYEILSVKGNILSKLMNLIYLLDYSTVYKAVLSKTDPSPTNSIDFVKKRL